MSKILIASNNKHKLDEFRDIFLESGLNIELITPKDVNLNNFDVDEAGLTFEENAFLKAQAFFNETGIPSIADDSGLEVDVLGLKPGVFSARYSGTHGDDSANRKKLLQEMINVPDNKRCARFRCIICFYTENLYLIASGAVEGKVSFEEKGKGGFGYDPIFIPNGYEKTFAEISQKEKNSISHRKNAIENFISKFKSSVK